MTEVRRAWRLLVLLAVLTGAIWRPAFADTTEAAIDAMLVAAHAHGCQAPTDVLDRILCDGVMRVGVRGNYPGFGIVRDGFFAGFDADVALAIAHRLGVRMQPVAVTPANRIEMVADDAVELVIATMSHSVTRDREIHFVRPHYYASHTAVIGPRRLILPNNGSIAGRTICVPLGNVSNTLLARQGARLLIFDQPRHLLDALRFDRCALVAHDDTYFAGSMADRAFSARFEEKLSILPTPWGIGIAKSNTETLGRLLALMVTDFHRSGVLIGLARKDSVSDTFLTEQRAVWSNPACILSSGDPSPTCMLNPVADADTPTVIAPFVVAVETWLQKHLGIHVVFAMLKGQAALALFVQGIVNTLILIFGAIVSTVCFALLFQAGLRHRRRTIGVAARWMTTVLQSSPTVLLLILGYFLATAVLAYGSGVALWTAIIVVGLCNGSFAGSAVADAAQTLANETGVRRPPLPAVLRHSATQVIGFAVNAARASAAASFIGTPDLVTALTDIASVTTERRTTFAILLVFYLAVLMLVVWLAGVLTRRLRVQEAAA
jgi:ABC-type amino acid transport substrate-binding protein/ABC-type amino acid transport system permease subunit